MAIEERIGLALLEEYIHGEDIHYYSTDLRISYDLVFLP
jgi:hypothetical protein